MPIHRAALTLLAAALAASCSNNAGPSGPRSIYALARVGPNHLPVPRDPDSPLPLLVADTLRLMQDRPRDDEQILRKTTITSNGPGGTTERSEAEFLYRIENGTLAFNECPVGALCIAGLVYAPRIFQIVGDSLFEILPLGVNTPPHIYGLVKQ